MPGASWTASQLPAGDVAALRGDMPELSAYRYETLRVEEDRKGEWPPESSVGRFVAGTSNDALRRALLDPVSDGNAIRA